MDLRGIADFGNTKYIVGGMIGNQEVTNKVWKLEYVTVSLEEKTLLDVSIYPNPVANFVTLETSNSAIKNVSLYSKEGKLIAEYSINNTKTEIDLTNLSSGIYLLRIQTGTNSVTKKIIKQ